MKNKDCDPRNWGLVALLGAGLFLGLGLLVWEDAWWQFYHEAGYSFVAGVIVLAQWLTFASIVYVVVWVTKQIDGDRPGRT